MYFLHCKCKQKHFFLSHFSTHNASGFYLSQNQGFFSKVTKSLLLFFNLTEVNERQTTKNTEKQKNFYFYL